MSHQIKIRRCTVNDYNKVLAVRPGTYDGNDILPSLYKHFLKEDNRIAHAAEIEGKFKAFVCHVVLDGGQTVSGQTARTSADSEKQSIYRHLLIGALQEIRMLHPGIKRLVGTTTAADIWEKNVKTFYKNKAEGKPQTKDLALFEDIRILNDDKRKFLCIGGGLKPEDFFFVSTPNFQIIEKLKNPKIGLIKLASREDIESLFLHKEKREGLLPSKYFVASWEVFGYHFENIPRFMDRKYVQFAGMFKTMKEDSNNISSLSLGLVWPCDFGHRFEIDYYGPNDPQFAKAHLIHYLPLVARYHKRGTIGLYLYASFQMPDDEIFEFSTKTLNFDTMNNTTFPQIQFEFDLKPLKLTSKC